MKLFFDIAELPDVTSLSKSTIEEEIRQGRFPAPRQLAGRRVGYLVEDVLEWARTRPRSTQPPPPNTGAPKPRGRRVTADAGGQALPAGHPGA